jgi:hypothetical protein
VWRLVRTVVPQWDADRFMAPDIEKAAQLVREGAVWDAVKQHIEPRYHSLSESLAFQASEKYEKMIEAAVAANAATAAAAAASSSTPSL